MLMLIFAQLLRLPPWHIIDSFIAAMPRAADAFSRADAGEIMPRHAPRLFASMLAIIFIAIIAADALL